ncbi:methionine ABC transporter ATP-binding protein [Wenjunlia vitaminophila]|uniref:Methionine ABC transporter ATP-binding protein n=1 Tax=Wenjunlia vitaminophila TaxID=76728 RepID=A0A0T6LKI1_WENVI|nr:ABC transporter ATP-binding protein [Wenjunlia vitaminophila]KRV46570.1 methionine ABC transporter ATP-binding protein [Wenjunlia vitaminophila]
MVTVTSTPAPYDKSATTQPLLQVRDLSVDFVTGKTRASALRGVNLSVAAGETLAVMGESGSGKSVTAQAIMGILDTPPARITSGQVWFQGQDLLTMPEEQRRRLRGAEIAIAFQDSLSALNPVMKVGDQIVEALRTHLDISRRDARTRARELLERVAIPAAAQRIDEYPHQFSGGMRQRCMIALALALSPSLLIADEPTTALDVTVQADILRLLREMKEETGMSMLLITHDVGVVAETADRVAVMYHGRVVEHGSVVDVLTRPAHAYTRALLSSVPRLDAPAHRLPAIPGTPPSLLTPITGCPFRPRCGFASPECAVSEPDLVEVMPDRQAACHHTQEVIEDD